MSSAGMDGILQHELRTRRMSNLYLAAMVAAVAIVIASLFAAS